MTNRYEVEGEQGAAQPGSDRQVLANLAGITSADELAEAELLLLHLLYEAVLIDALPDRRLKVADLTGWHRRWLGNLYEFAAATFIPRLLEDFERQCLHRFTPCHGLGDEDLAHAMAVCHVELILIHPFRGGNGRLAHLLADVMAVQAGRPPLDYSTWDADKEGYFAAIRSGQGNDYAPMQQRVLAAMRADV